MRWLFMTIILLLAGIFALLGVRHENWVLIGMAVLAVGSTMLLLYVMSHW